MRAMNIALVAGFLVVAAPTVFADELSAEIAELRQLVDAVRESYEARMQELEDRLARAERLAAGASRDAEEAYDIAEQTAIDQTSGAAAANVFNPALGVVLIGRLADIRSGWEQIPGVLPGAEVGPGDSGFALGEAEVNMKATIDPSFYGNLTLAVESDAEGTEIGLEEAWIQSTALPFGTTITAGRYFSETGYLNKFHRHADDFVDRPLPYQAFLGNQYIVDGMQARWVLPAPLLVEVGAELDWGSGFPVTSNGDTSPAALTVFTNIGGDIGASNSWQIGWSFSSADILALESGMPGMTFTGDSELTVFDFVWKWAPDGNASITNFKLQGEYLRRKEDGTFAAIDYNGTQTGWYLQGVWQFAQRWRVALRHDALDVDNGNLLSGTLLATPGHNSRRESAMLDWSPSDFSRLRLQYARDEVLPETDNQWFLQYIMSIGAHGAHAF